MTNLARPEDSWNSSTNQIDPSDKAKSIDIKSSSCKNKQKLRLQYFIIRSNEIGSQQTQKHQKIARKRTIAIRNAQTQLIHRKQIRKREFPLQKMKDKYCLIDYFPQEDFLCKESRANARYLLGMFLNFLDHKAGNHDLLQIVTPVLKYFYYFCLMLIQAYCKVLLFRLNRRLMKRDHHVGNRIEVSQFGATFLKQLTTSDQKENRQLQSTWGLRRRGDGLDFRSFAHQTQSLIGKQVQSLWKTRGVETQGQEARRKQILHHNNWVNQQKLIQHKLADAYSRLQQTKYSDYDCKSQSNLLKNKRSDILQRWECSYYTRNQRARSKLKKIMQRKYPNRQQNTPKVLLRTITPS